MNLEKLIKEQKKISEKIKIITLKNKIEKVAGIDISFYGDNAICSIVILDFKTLTEIENILYKDKANFPYISGFLAFREGPIILKAIEKIKNKPDIYIFDGQGIAHPRKCGIASHIGVLIEKPTIGVGKSHLYGKYKEPDNKKFSFSYLYDKEKNKIGVVLRTKENCKPVFISPGNLIDINDSIDVIKKCTTIYRIPEPTRLAHIKSKQKIF